MNVEEFKFKKTLYIILGFGFNIIFFNLNNNFIKSNQFCKGPGWMTILILKNWQLKNLDDSNLLLTFKIQSQFKSNGIKSFRN
jgi:hypothetical protein